jgi:zinc protease
MKKTNSFVKTQLSNGLTVSIKEVHTAPVASFWVWYRVGSRNEHTGITGISHWVEHMLFKGTPTFPKGVAEKAIAREGGVFNGMTWYDFTTYFATLPADRIELALRIETDRMANALFELNEVETERTVIISERQGAENNPEFLLNEELMAAAFRVHPYGTDTIGHMCDLETLTRDQLYTAGGCRRGGQRRLPPDGVPCPHRLRTGFLRDDCARCRSDWGQRSDFLR